MNEESSYAIHHRFFGGGVSIRFDLIWQKEVKIKKQGRMIIDDDRMDTTVVAVIIAIH